MWSRGVLTTICSPGPRGIYWEENGRMRAKQCHVYHPPVITISIGGIGPIRWYGYHSLVVYGIVFQIAQNPETAEGSQSPLVAVDVKGVYYQAVTLMVFWRNWNSIIKVGAVRFAAFARNSRCEKLLKVCRTVPICCPLLNCHEEWVELGLNGPELGFLIQLYRQGPFFHFSKATNDENSSAST